MRFLKKTALMVIVVLGAASQAHATTALKQVQVSNGSQIDLLFDGKVQKSQIHTEFINDIIQLSIQDVSVYPAKISSVNGGSLTKIFAYQYAPKLVRCRLTVKGKAEDFKDKLDIKTSGRVLTVRMGAGDSSPAAKASVTSHEQAVTAASEPDAEEKALLSRVMAASAPTALPAQHEKSQEKLKEREKDKEKDILTSSSAAAVSAAQTEGAPNTENLPIHLTGENSPKLGGAKPLPSPLKAFGKMGIVLSIFGLFAFALKRYAQGRADSRLGDAGVLAEAANKGGWMGALGRMAKKGLSREGRMIEVLSTHYLGPKKSIAVVRVAGRVLVLGVSNESINLITQLSGEEGLDSLDLGELAGPMVGQPNKRPAPAGASAGFADLLQAERSKPAFVNPSGPAAYGALPAAVASKGNVSTNARAQIRNRLEGLKQL